MLHDPMEFGEKYRVLFFAHVTDMVKNETGHTPTLSNPGLEFTGQTPVDAEGLSHYSHLIYKISFSIDSPLHATTILHIEKWVDVDTCKLLRHTAENNEYLFEIRLLTRD